MEEQENETRKEKLVTLEHTDMGESLRQLWWTIGVTVVGLAIAAFFFL